MRLHFAFILLIAALVSPLQAAQDGLCTGKFPNPITDICWSCMFPMKVGGAISFSNGQEDYDTGAGGGFACWCGENAKLGIKTSFWEMTHVVSVTPMPYCEPFLNGARLNVGFNAESFGGIEQRTDGGALDAGRSSFRHTHWIKAPMMFITEAVLDDNCLETNPIDIDFSELRLDYNDPELAGVLNPDSFLFASMPAFGAESANCIAATAGFPIPGIYWGACSGHYFPSTGHAQAHQGEVQAGSLLAAREIMSRHRSLTQLAASGSQGMCGYFAQVIPDYRQYKLSLLPARKLAGKCCDPVGRSSMIYGLGRDVAKDNMFAIFRKRDCCQGIVKP